MIEGVPAHVFTHSMDLRDATCLVTGANRGIGRAIAAALAAKPVAKVLAGVRDPAATSRSPARSSRSSSTSRAASRSKPGGIAIADGVDVLVNNAGLFEGGKLEEQDPAAIDAMVQVTLTATMQLTRLALPGMLSRRRGLIVNNASISGYVHMPGASTYTATKAGVVGFSESLRRELRGTGVEVLHLVTPGIETDMLDATRDAYEGHAQVEMPSQFTAEEWAARVVRSIEQGDSIRGPGGILALGKLASRGPARLLDLIAARVFSR